MLRLDVNVDSDPDSMAARLVEIEEVEVVSTRTRRKM